MVDDWIVAAAVQTLPAVGGAPCTGRVMPVAELQIPGRHNVSNALAAVSVALLFGVAPDAIRGAAGAFRGVEHRLEIVAEFEDVRFVNDSQGTQPDAVIAALNAFDRPIVLIAGGRDKGIDLTGLAEVVARRAYAAVLIGESAEMLERLFGAAGLAAIEHAPTLDDAVAVAFAIARARLVAGTEHDPGPATVLLSPAATSFDMFEDYAARGRAFKQAVADLAERRARGDTSLPGPAPR